MRLDENRKVAWAVLAVCVLLSVFALGGGALGRERTKALKVFNDGTDPRSATRYSMDAYLDTAGENAGIMANEAVIHIGASDLTNETMVNAGLIGNDAVDLDARFAAYTQLKEQVEKIYNQMYSRLDEKTFKNFKLAYVEFWGQDDLIQRDDYHKLAKGYNQLISGFPGGVVAGITGQSALHTFGG